MTTIVAWDSSVVHPLIREPQINVILLDCSASMHPFEGVVREAFSRSLAGLQRSRQAYRTYLAVIGFGVDVVPLVELTPVSRLKPLQAIAYSNGTRLMETAYCALRASLLLDDLLRSEKRMPNFTISVITDGMDNVSHPQYERRLRSLVADARSRSFDLRLYTLGICARSLARVMGFPPESSQEIAPSPGAISRTLDHILHV